jgi:hypothetical protein
MRLIGESLLRLAAGDRSMGAFFLRGGSFNMDTIHPFSNYLRAFDPSTLTVARCTIALHPLLEAIVVEILLLDFHWKYIYFR